MGGEFGGGGGLWELCLTFNLIFFIDCRQPLMVDDATAVVGGGVMESQGGPDSGTVWSKITS